MHLERSYRHRIVRRHKKVSFYLQLLKIYGGTDIYYLEWVVTLVHPFFFLEDIQHLLEEFQNVVLIEAILYINYIKTKHTS